jgi:hypothetical protein
MGSPPLHGEQWRVGADRGHLILGYTWSGRMQKPDVKRIGSLSAVLEHPISILEFTLYKLAKS